MKILETICIRITKHCNLQCIHCRAGSSPFTKEYMNVELLFELLIELKEIGLKHISISGGEPFLVLNLLDFTKRLIDAGFYITITTNGTLQRIFDLLESEIASSIKLKLRFSLDGDEQTNDEIRGVGTFNKCLSTMQRMQWLGNPLSLNTVVYKWNYKGTLNLINEFEHNLINEWAFISPVQKGSGKNIFIDRNLYPQLLNNCENALIKTKFNGRIKKWDFINNPCASALLDSNGDIILTGISEESDVILTNVFENFNIHGLRDKIEKQKLSLKKQYFNWNRW